MKNNNRRLNITVDSLLKNKSSNNFNNVIIKIIQNQINYTNRMLEQLSNISSINDIEKKEKEFEDFEKKNIKNMEYIEYLANPDSEIYNKNKIIASLRHNYYKLQDTYFKIKSDIISKKLNNNEKMLTNSLQKLTKLETRFEGIGGTVISIIISISVITTAISAIDKLEEKIIPFFIFSIVWFGMTYLLFVHCLFKKDNKDDTTAVRLYTVITAIWFMIMLLSFGKEMIKMFELLL